MMSNELLRLEHLSIRYKVEDGYLSAVKDVSLGIQRGEVFAMVGESGCGKSTVAQSIMRLSMDHNEQITGNIIFKDKDLNALSEAEMEAIRGREIGMIFQDPLDSLNPVYRVGWQVAEALMLDGMSRAQAEKRTIELFQDVQIPSPKQRIKSYPHELSGGMRQRVMIAMMLARNPSLLIADEPTTALDVTVEAQILQIMRRLRDQYGTSILVITHNFGIVAEIADRVGIMYAGELVEQGPVDQVFDHPAHPYSQVLLAALPRFSKREGRIRTIDGTVLRIVGEFTGCRFANRCPYATDKCRNSDPPIRRLNDSHFMRCHMEDASWKMS